MKKILSRVSALFISLFFTSCASPFHMDIPPTVQCLCDVVSQGEYEKALILQYHPWEEYSAEDFPVEIPMQEFQEEIFNDLLLASATLLTPQHGEEHTADVLEPYVTVGVVKDETLSSNAADIVIHYYGGDDLVVCTNNERYAVNNYTNIAQRFYEFVSSYMENDDPIVPSTSRPVSLAYVYPWIYSLQKENIDYAVCEQTRGSISPHLDVFDKHFITSGEADIQALYDFLTTTTVVKTQDPHRDGGGVAILTIYLKNGGRYGLIAYYGGFTDDNGDYYEYQTAFPKLETEYGVSFLWHALWDMQLYQGDNVIRAAAFCENFLGKLIFRECDPQGVEIKQAYADYVFKNVLGEISFLNGTVFKVTTATSVEYYEILNDYHFANCLPEYSA